jgi:Zn-dependent protease with chaperone function
MNNNPSDITFNINPPDNDNNPTAQAVPQQAVHVLPYRNEEPLFWISVYFAVSMWLVMLLVSFGLIIPIMLLAGLLGMFAHSLLIAWLKGNSVKVTAQQFPDLHALYGQTCARLGIDKQPELYLAQSDGMLNAMATRFMRRDYVVLLSAVVDALEDRPQAIKFYMGHELGHIKRKHLSRHWWLWPGMLFPLISPAYSRAREYTCDRHGFASCDNLDDAKRALAVLVAGPERWKNLHLASFEEQAQATGGFWMAVNELTADYPWHDGVGEPQCGISTAQLFCLDDCLAVTAHGLWRCHHWFFVLADAGHHDFGVGSGFSLLKLQDVFPYCVWAQPHHQVVAKNV